MTFDPKGVLKNQALLPTEKDYIGKKGYSRTYAKDGTYEWSYKFKPNENGKGTKEALEVQEQLRPYQLAEQDRMDSRPKPPREVLRDSEGVTHHIDPAKAESTALRHGWSHVWSPGGEPVRSGVGGMLFRRGPGGWEPLGRWCLTTPHVFAKRPKGGKLNGECLKNRPWYDPDGIEWVYRKGEWVNG